MSTPSIPSVDPPSESGEEQRQGLFWLVVVAAIAGALTGLVGGLFRVLLEKLYEQLFHLLAFWRQLDSAGALIPGWCWALLGGGLCLGMSRWLVRFAPLAGGSGIQHVEGVFHGVAKPASFKVLPIKFIGGLLAMAPGAALGREGPTVQMAAVIGNVCGEIARLSRADRFLLYTAVAGSGLSVAFNAPLAGAAFVIEEVARRVTLRRLLVTLTAIAMATLSFWTVYGNTLEFHIGVPPAQSFSALTGMTLLGALCGCIGVFYNQTLLATLNRVEALPGMTPEVKAALIGMGIGLLAWFYPIGLGGGERQVQKILTGEMAPLTLAVLLAVRWVMSPLSYAAGTPGGLFSPMLLLGAALGSLFAAILAATGFFTLSAPDFALVVPLLSASVAAVLVASLLGNPPIYDSLLARMVAARKPV